MHRNTFHQENPSDVEEMKNIFTHRNMIFNERLNGNSRVIDGFEILNKQYFLCQL